MEEKVKALISDAISSLNLVVDNVKYEEEFNHHFLRICLDSEDIIDLDKIVLATNIINPIIDEANLIKEEYHLDIYGKSKGCVENEEN